MATISYHESESFIKYANQHRFPIKSYPETGEKSLPAYLGFPQNKRQQKQLITRLTELIPFILNEFYLILSFQVTSEGDKHALLISYHKKTLEIFDSNGFQLGNKTLDYINNLINFLSDKLKVENVYLSNKVIHNINLIGSGHCDALTLLYIILRHTSLKMAEKIYQMDWNQTNITRLNSYLKKKQIDKLIQLVN
jgi:hypothetical protein